MVLLALFLGGQGISVGAGGASVSVSGPAIVGTILIIQLVLVARRLLREGYAFEDIRTALLAEAQIQKEEADVLQQRRWLRRIDTLWHRLWAGRFGCWFFRVAGAGGHTGERLARTVAALENLRLAILRLQMGVGSVDDITT